MPRRAPTDERGAIHHVTIRGVDRREIFRGEHDRGVFVDRFEQLVCDLGFACDALTLIANHVHAVLQTGDEPLAKLMHRLNFVYAQRLNRECARSGYLFESRYYAKRVTDEGGHILLVAYVVGNAARHGLSTVDALPEDPWNLLAALHGKRRPRRFESIARMRTLLGGRAWREQVRAAATAPDAAGAALEPDLLAELDYLIREMCARNGVPREHLGRPEHRLVRRALLESATRVLGVSITDASKALAMSRASAHRTLARPTK
ncbi:MAG: transposase [Deltaproteobacteria bacterium]|nr:transposase [Deltaproteobacteria bacterium]